MDKDYLCKNRSIQIACSGYCWLQHEINEVYCWLSKALWNLFSGKWGVSMTFFEHICQVTRRIIPPGKKKSIKK